MPVIVADAAIAAMSCVRHVIMLNAEDSIPLKNGSGESLLTYYTSIRLSR